MLVEILIT